jgi:hypothetical protein
MNPTEPFNMPEIGAVVRCKASMSRSPKGTSARVKAILSEDDCRTVVLQSIWGVEIAVPAWEYSRLFEECGPRDVAREYWEST